MPVTMAAAVTMLALTFVREQLDGVETCPGCALYTVGIWAVWALDYVCYHWTLYSIMAVAILIDRANKRDAAAKTTAEAVAAAPE